MDFILGLLAGSFITLITFAIIMEAENDTI
jgi:hypothetical protein